MAGSPMFDGNSYFYTEIAIYIGVPNKLGAQNHVTRPAGCSTSKLTDCELSAPSARSLRNTTCKLLGVIGVIPRQIVPPSQTCVCARDR
jgi:hypothetical protein